MSEAKVTLGYSRAELDQRYHEFQSKLTHYRLVLRCSDADTGQAKKVREKDGKPQTPRQK